MVFMAAFGLLLLIAPHTSLAQVVCPPGYAPIGGGGVVGDYASGCAPIGGGEEQPEEIWEDRWGAVAIADGAAFGYSENMASQEEASQSALEACRKNAVNNACEVKMTYYNTCLAISWGDNGYFSEVNPSIEQAQSTAQAGCQKDYTNCKPYYSACSYSERVQ